jgi:hypothetical protein
MESLTRSKEQTVVAFKVSLIIIRDPCQIRKRKIFNPYFYSGLGVKLRPQLQRLNDITCQLSSAVGRATGYRLDD